MTAIVDPHTARRGRHIRLAAWLAAGALLLGPLIAMRFTREVAWSPFDFAIAATLLFGALGLFELVAHRTAAVPTYRAGLALALLGTVLLVWIDGAVGIAGCGADAIDAAFGAVPAIGLLTALAGRLRSRAMVRAMLAMAGVQLSVGAGAAIVSPLTAPLVVLTLGFVVWWLVAAAVFARTSR